MQTTIQPDEQGLSDGNRPNRGTTAYREFDEAEAARLTPLDYFCLIRLDPVEQMSKGGIIMTEIRTDRNQMAETFATLVKVGANAFTDFGDVVPEPGDRILVKKYAGQMPVAGDSTSLFRLVTDKEIIAILEKEDGA